MRYLPAPRGAKRTFEIQLMPPLFADMEAHSLLDLSRDIDPHHIDGIDDCHCLQS
jgi:hypothetical protein